MIKSMTAFARKQIKGSWGVLTIEMRSVNHRYLDMNLRLPEGWRELEMPLRTLIQQQVSRGKVDVLCRFSKGVDESQGIKLNKTIAHQVVKAAREISLLAANDQPLDPLKILQWPNVVEVELEDYQAYFTEVTSSFESLLSDFSTARASEGEKLTVFIQERLKKIKEHVTSLVPLIPELVQAHKQKLHDRLAEFQETVDEERLAQELALFAQKADVAEELDRLTAHVAEIEKALAKGGACGRRLDFLIQELHREASTLGAKSVAVTSSHASVDLKVLIEQMREQVQNIE